MSHRILVIDHHPQGLERVVGPLRGAGYEVAIARTAADGASSFGHFEPDLVFIAARLPRTHGTVLCRELKRTGAGNRTPIVLIVEGTGVQIDLPPLDQFGADRLLQKPVGSEELLTVCAELLYPDRHPAGAKGGAATDGEGVDYPDDGLNTALEELDALEFDLPESFLRNVPGETASMNTVPLSNDHGEDIENHIDDLFSGESIATPPAAKTEPSTGHDGDANEAVLDQLDLDNELNTRLGRNRDTPAPRRRASDRPAVDRPAPQPAPPPVSPSVTATQQRPVPASGPVAGRFQTEALTRKATVSNQISVVADRTPVPPRWLWGAIPVTVAIVALAVFFMSRPASPPPAPVPAPVQIAETPRTPAGTTPFLSLMAMRPDSVDASVETTADPDVDLPEPVTEVPQRAEPTPVATARPVEREPEPAPVVTAPDPEPEPVAIAATETEAPELPAPVIELETPIQTEAPATDDDPFEESAPEEPSEPIVDATLDDPPSAPAAEPLIPEATPQAPPEPAPVTRDAALLARVEPRVSERDLKRGGGTVILKVRVGKSGAVSRVIVEQGLPRSPTLEGAAVAAVLRWRYEPALDAGEPVEAWATARFTFGD